MRRNTFSHTVPTMFALARATEQFLQSLPAEFTKKQFDELRKACPDRPLSLQTCRDYGFIVVVRTEPTTYTREESVWIDAKGRKFTRDEMDAMDRKTIATLFNCPQFTQNWISLYCLPYEDMPMEHSGERNIFAVNTEKFKCFFEKNA